MRVFVAGGTGAVGRRLVPLLVKHGHEVVAMTRDPDKQAMLTAAGAEAVVADGLDCGQAIAAVTQARPDVVVHQMTALSGEMNMRRFARTFAETNRLRTTGTDHLLEAAVKARATRFVAQSFAGWPYAREGGPVKTEEHRLDPQPPPELRTTLDAIRYLETAVTRTRELAGVALRYGGFYGPGTSLGRTGVQTEMVRRRRFPIIGDGNGIWSLVHIDDVATATAKAVEHGEAGVYNITDDDPAPVRAWLPYLAEILGAKPPRHLPLWVGRLVGGEHTVALMTSVRGASNAKAKRMLGWVPRYPSWRTGFKELELGA